MLITNTKVVEGEKESLFICMHKIGYNSGENIHGGSRILKNLYDLCKHTEKQVFYSGEEHKVAGM